ncbi:cytochrome P450 [Zavarzinia sp. CC-PAN008]|uniref:cytochrome P450 n=1 Tax=Zavarzinia sp. CC-PAN008 TaxID=3243332 RepID=UPI003F7457B4
MTIEPVIARKLSDGTIDVVSPQVYADEEAIQSNFAWLRKNSPVHRMTPEGFRPFWSVTRHADILEIERQNDKFINDPRPTLATIEAEEQVKAFTGGSNHLVRSLVQMDNPDHAKFRAMTQGWFMPANLKRRIEPKLAQMAREHVDRMLELGDSCDFVKDIAVWYPLRVIMEILGVPREDEGLMLKLTQELFGPTDPETKREKGTTDDLIKTVMEFYAYFNAMTEDRRKNPKDDLATLIANAKIDGEPIGNIEALGYYVIVAAAGHDTTSSSTAGGIHALIQNPDEMRKLRARPDLMKTAVDEAIRWTTPVKHFMRTATEDYVLSGTKIAAGDSLMLHYPSANRDETVFEDPYTFKVDRDPNPHLAFGFGAHHCLGHLLAKLEMRYLYEELLGRLDHIELAGEPAWVEASFVSGLKRLPIRYALRKAAA